MPLYTKDNFPELKSQLNWFWTWSIRILFGICFSWIAILFFLFPVLFYWEDYMETENAIVFMIFYYPLILWACYAILKHIKKVKSNYTKSITVDKKGIHFHKKNGEIESILYTDLQKSKNAYTSDVYAKSTGRYSPTLLYVHLKERAQSIFFNKTNYYTGNHKNLRAHFIQGIRLYRTDLKISPSVFSDFYIHPETFDFNKKEYIKTIIAVVIFLILILIGIEFWMKYRFGNSLIFNELF